MQIGDCEFNYTYNVSDMWYSAIPGTGIRTHYGMTGEQALVPLMKIYTYMVENNIELLGMQPSNGWGTFEGALSFVNKLIVASIQNPNQVWSGD